MTLPKRGSLRGRSPPKPNTPPLLAKERGIKGVRLIIISIVKQLTIKIDFGIV